MPPLNCSPHSSEYPFPISEYPLKTAQSRSIVVDLLLHPLPLLVLLLLLFLPVLLLPQVPAVLLAFLQLPDLLRRHPPLLILVIALSPSCPPAHVRFLQAPSLVIVVSDERKQNQDRVMYPILEQPHRNLEYFHAMPVTLTHVGDQLDDGQLTRLQPAEGGGEKLVRLVVGEDDLGEDDEQQVEEEQLRQFGCQAHFKLMLSGIFSYQFKGPQRVRGEAFRYERVVEGSEGLYVNVRKRGSSSYILIHVATQPLLADPPTLLLSSVIKQYYIYCRMDTNYSFSGMTLTEIFQIQPLQSLFIKFWYLGLTSEPIVSPEDSNVFKAIRKNVSFANCFTFEMPIRTYINYIDKILQALATIDPKKTFQILLGHLRNNKVISVSFELFGVAFLQLFGRILELLNTQMMNKILRKIFYEITVISKMGVSTLKVKGIRSISFEQLIPNFNELLEEKANTNPLGANSKLNPEQVSIHHGQLNRSTTEREYDIKTIKGRLQAQRDHNYELRESQGEHYPIGDRIRNKQRASISCYMMGGFQIVDYSDSINQLHKKLLTKILLNK